MDIHKSIYGYPRIGLWISTNRIMDIHESNYGYQEILMMDIHDSNYGYPYLIMDISE